MEDKFNVPIPYFVHEEDMARMERSNKRTSVLAIVAIVLLFITNAVWLWAWNQYEYVDTETVTTSVQQDGSGNNIYGDGNEVDDGANNNDNGN